MNIYIYICMYISGSPKHKLALLYIEICFKIHYNDLLHSFKEQLYWRLFAINF